MTKEELKKEAEEYYEDETEGTFQICEDCYWFADAVQTAYVDSAEPREKRIAELEHQLTHRNCVDCSNHSSNLRIRNLELEKENAELKSEKGCKSCTKFDEVQLTKAKELLKRWANSYGYIDVALCKQTDQFINSEVNNALS